MTRLAAGPLELDLSPLGARMAALRFHGRDLILPTPEGIDPASAWGYVGAIMGPVTNRLVTGAHVPGHHGPTGEIILHGDPHGIHAMTWEETDVSERHARFEITLPAGHGGFAARREIAADYALLGEDGIRLTLSARSDGPTCINLASHPYWTMDGTPGITGQHLRLAADHILPIDDDVLPTGEVLTVAGTAYDFTAARALEPGAPDLDHNFCLADARRPTPQPAAWLTSRDGWTMALETTEPGLQVYDGRTTGEYDVGPYAGLALEPQLWPNAPAHGHFPSIALEAGETYEAVSDFRFSRPE